MSRPRPTDPDSVLAALADTAVRCRCGSQDDVLECGRPGCYARVCADHRQQCAACDRIFCLPHAEREGSDWSFFCYACQERG